MARKLVRDLKAIKRRHRLQLDVAETELSYYYFHFQEDLSQLNRLIATFDEQGVPLNRAYIDVEQPALHYYPISIGQYALAVFHSYLDTGDEEKRQHFLRIVDWFVDNKERDPQLGTFWRTYIPKPEYQVAEGWKSAFSQSRGISLLLRAWQISSDNQYLRLATDALYCFGYDIQEGGVAIRRANQAIIYEEYVAKYPTRVLDGHIFALFGLYDYIRAVSAIQEPAGSALARQYFDEGVQGLKVLLPEYELAGWLRFNLCEIPDYPKDDPCTIGYMNLIIDQLLVLHAMTDDMFFADKAKQYRTYLKAPNIFRMYVNKYKSLRKLNRL